MTASNDPPKAESKPWYRPRLNWFLPISESRAIKSEIEDRSRLARATWKAALETRRERSAATPAVLDQLSRQDLAAIARASKVYWSFGLLLMIFGGTLAWFMLLATSLWAAINLAIGATALWLMGATIAARACRDGHMAARGRVIAWPEFFRNPRWWLPW